MLVNPAQVTHVIDDGNHRVIFLASRGFEEQSRVSVIETLDEVVVLMQAVTP